MKKFSVAFIGGTALLIGVAMLVLPGPGLPIIAAGLAILATEFLWARRAWRKTRGTLARARRKFGLRDWLRCAKARWNWKNSHQRTNQRTALGRRHPAA